MADDILDDDAWFKNVQSTQRDGLPGLSTSASKTGQVNLGVTAFSVSEFMQGSALYAPQTMQYAIEEQNLNSSFSWLLRNDKYKKAISDVSMLPFQALAEASAGSTTASQPTSGQMSTSSDGTGVTPPPPDVQQYGNGKIPDAFLTPIGIENYKLHKDVAPAFRALVVAAKNDNITIGVNSAYRSYDDQVRVYNEYGPSRAGKPGSSNHGWGNAVDMTWNGGQSPTDSGYKWLNDNANKYGFVHPQWAKSAEEGGPGTMVEPWHWEYRGKYGGS